MRTRMFPAAAVCFLVGALDARPSGAGGIWMCSTPSSEPVSDCFDWVTGPASSENSGVQMTYFRASGERATGTLWSTDMGIPVTDPLGSEAVMMVYGDTFVRNENTLEFELPYALCRAQTPATTCASGCGRSDPNCMTYFSSFSKAQACEYLCAPAKAVKAFYNWSNTTFFRIHADPAKSFGIAFDEHLVYKHIVNTARIEDAAPCVWGSDCFTGVYGYDYFYACPGSLVDCPPSSRLLYIVTATMVWVPIEPSTPLGKIVQAVAMDGTGFYKFGTVDDIHTTTNGCRLPFDTYVDDPAYYLPGYYPHCSDGPGVSVQPVHPHQVPYTVPPLEIRKTLNPNVLWGWGSKFEMATPLRGFVDRHDPSGGFGYVYFLGSRERTWGGTPTNRVYMARIRASEDALAKGQFEYLLHVDEDEAVWGSYDRATPVFTTDGFGASRISSAIFKNGVWYVSVDLRPDGVTWSRSGMAVFTSPDGFTWTLADIVEYSDIYHLTKGPVLNVYGHYWVPSAIFDKSEAIPYVFSVWKASRGYFEDFFFSGDPHYPIASPNRFRDYNTKMYWYFL